MMEMDAISAAGCTPRSGRAPDDIFPKVHAAKVAAPAQIKNDLGQQVLILFHDHDLCHIFFLPGSYHNKLHTRR
jgi:hypothetical protein